ncbi:MAG: hypothetical protein ABIQ08_14665, partial [Duganella sp.]
FSSQTLKKTPRYQHRLDYPTITSLAEAGRTQRHVTDSITTLRACIASAIAAKLQRCPCCRRMSQLNL